MRHSSCSTRLGLPPWVLYPPLSLAPPLAMWLAIWWPTQIFGIEELVRSAPSTTEIWVNPHLVAWDCAKLPDLVQARLGLMSTATSFAEFLASRLPEEPEVDHSFMLLQGLRRGCIRLRPEVHAAYAVAPSLLSAPWVASVSGPPAMRVVVAGPSAVSSGGKGGQGRGDSGVGGKGGRGKGASGVGGKGSRGKGGQGRGDSGGGGRVRGKEASRGARSSRSLSSSSADPTASDTSSGTGGEGGEMESSKVGRKVGADGRRVANTSASAAMTVTVVTRTRAAFVPPNGPRRALLHTPLGMLRVRRMGIFCISSSVHWVLWVLSFIAMAQPQLPLIFLFLLARWQI